MKNKTIYIVISLLLAICILWKFDKIFGNVYGYEQGFNSIPDISTLTNGDLNLPSKYDLRNVNGISYMTPVKNQGNLGLCWAFSTTTAFESNLKRSGYVSIDFNDWYSPYQIDTLVTPKIKNPDINYVSYRISDKNRKLGEGAAIDFGYRALTTAYSPVLYKNFNEEKYREHFNNILTNKFNSIDIYNEKNIDYYVTDYDLLSKINDISLVNVIKYYLYNYGAVIVGTIIPFDFFDDLSGEKIIDTSLVDSTQMGFKNGYAEHAMTIIGWDDSKNSWILQNSWGPNSLPYLYMTYNSYGQYAGIKKIEKKDWNNRYYGKNSSNNDYEAIYEFEKIPDNNEIIHSITGYFDATGKYNIYMSSDGTDDSYELIETMDIKMAGNHTIYLENENLLLNNNKFKFKITYNGNRHYDESFVNYLFLDLYVFTKDTNTSTDKKLYLYDLYDLTSRNQTLSVKFKGVNISDKSDIKIRFKNEIDEDITGNFILNDSYYSNNYGEFNFIPNFNQLPDEQTKYTVEILLNDNIVSSKKFIVSNIDDVFKSGIGTRDNPFIITSAEQLQKISSNTKFLNYSYKLGCNIDAKDLEFDPIGDYTNPFTGTFDGNNFTISNLNISPNNLLPGLFGYVDNALIENIKFVNPKIIKTDGGRVNAGILAADINKSEIKNIIIKDGIININAAIISVGMVVGDATSSYFSNLYSSGNIYTEPSDTYSVIIGGLIGNVRNNSEENLSSYNIKNSEFSGEINYDISNLAQYRVGGIIGTSSDQNFKLNNILFSGLISDSCQNNIEACPNNYFGYFVGRGFKEVTDSIYYYKNNINIIGGNLKDKLDDYSSIYAIVDNDMTGNSSKYINKNSEAFLNKNTYSSFNFENTWYMSENGPRLQFLRDITDKTDSIGESNIYIVDSEKSSILNVKPYSSNLTKEKFISNFDYFSGEIYQSDGVTLVNDEDIIKTGMIVKKGSKNWLISVNGDITGDGRINTLDIITLRRELAGGYNLSLSNAQLKAADINGDERLNTLDIILMRRGIAGGYNDICIWGDGC